MKCLAGDHLGRAADGSVRPGGRVLVPARTRRGADDLAAARPAASGCHRSRGRPGALPGPARAGPHGDGGRQRAEVSSGEGTRFASKSPG